MSINTCYRLFMENPKAIALLSLPENYQKEDFAEYLDENVIYADCRQINQADTIYKLIREATDSQKILLPHSDTEIDDTTLDVNLLEWACRNSMMFRK